MNHRKKINAIVAQTQDPLEIPRYWKWSIVVLPFILGLLMLAMLVWLIWTAGASTCTSEAHLSDLCDPYLPGVPGKEWPQR